ncbi:MAG: hypothetical protein HOC20_11305 [Chloroflexi bacterium]|jgi:hypothetical protein|nr:hypothetical protein [Chloroflexota bacterium]
MTEQQKIEYSQLEVGYEFPPASYNLGSADVSAYLKATGETDRLFQNTGIVPPTAIAAWSLIALLDYVDMPSGTIHLAQELESVGIAKESDTITCHARVSRKQERSGLRLLDIEFKVQDQNGDLVVAGKSSFNFP